MVENTKEKKSKRSTTKPKLKVVTYTFKDGLNCTVVTPLPEEKPADPIPPTALGLAMPTTLNNNMKKNTATISANTNSQTAPAASSNAKPKDYSDLRKGVKKKEAIDIVHNFQFPDRPFTIKEILLGTGINHWYVTSYIKTHAKVVGDAPKTPGVRGKIAKLYQLEQKA